jgi:rhodanese-related sulfurtransferase
MPQHITRGIKAMLEEANAQIETLSAAEAIKAAQGDDVILVDIRDPREIERDGRIPGAFACTRGMLEFWIDPDSPYAKPVFQENKKFIFHCAGGLRSALAAKTALDMGLKPVAHIGGSRWHISAAASAPGATPAARWRNSSRARRRIR